MTSVHSCPLFHLNCHFTFSTPVIQLTVEYRVSQLWQIDLLVGSDSVSNWYLYARQIWPRKSHVTAHDKSRSLELVNSCCVFCSVVDEVSVSKCWLVEHDNSKRLWCVQWIDVFCQKCWESIAEFCKSSNHLAMLVRQQKKHGFFRCRGEHIEQLTPDRVYGRFPDGYFPQMVFFPERRFPCGHFPGWSFSPYETFPRKTSWMVGLMFNCSWRWSLTERPYCVYLNGFTVNLAH